MKEADAFQTRWFAAHPKIAKWQERIKIQLMTKRYVENAFGYKRYYFERIEELLKEALAWIPQSTVAIATNLLILKLDKDPEIQKRDIQLLLQTHDSTNFQWPSYQTEWIKANYKTYMQIEVPYPTPLIFVPSMKYSDKSWGDCKEVK